MVRLVGKGEKGFGQKRFLSRIAPQEEKGTCMWLIFYPQSVFHGYPIEYKMGTESSRTNVFAAIYLLPATRNLYQIH
jgi:hypothetical protein